MPYAQSLCELLPFECVASIQWTIHDWIDDKEHPRHWTFLRSYDKSDLAEPRYYNGVEIDADDRHVHRCVVINLGKTPTTDESRWSNFMIIFDNEGCDEFREDGRFLQSGTPNYNFTREWFIEQSQCNSYDELDENLKKHVQDMIDYEDAVIIKQQAVDDFNLDEGIMQSNRYIANVRERYEILKTLIPDVQKVCDLLPIYALPIIRYVNQNVENFETIEAAIKNTDPRHPDFYLDVELAAIVGTEFDNASYKDIFMMNVDKKGITGNVCNNETGKVQFIDDVWLKSQANCLSYDELDNDIKINVVEFAERGIAVVKENVVEDFNLDESKLRIFVQAICESDEFDQFIDPNQYFARRHRERLRRQESELKSLLPKMQKICDLLPIVCKAEIRYEIGDITSVCHSLDEVFDLCEEKNTDLYHVKLRAGAHAQNSTIADDFMSFYFMISDDNIITGELLEIDYYTNQKIDIDWLIRQTTAKTYDDLDPFLKKCVDSFIETGKVEVRPEAVEDFDLS